MPEITIIAELLGSLGLDPKIISWIIGLITIVWMIIKYKWQLTAKAEWKVTKQMLTNHSLFERMNYYIKYKIPNLPIENEFKRAVTKDFLAYKFEIFYNKINSFIKDEEYKGLNDSELHSALSKLTTDSIQKYNLEMEEKWVPKLFIDKFNKWHSNRVDWYIDIIWDVCNAKWATNEEKMYNYLDHTKSVLHSTIWDAEKTLKYINWDLIWLEYKWITCKKDNYAK